MEFRRVLFRSRKTFRPHAEALPILIGSPALLVPALCSNPVEAGKPALLFVLCHLQFFAVDLDEFAVLLLKAGMSIRDMVTDRAFLGSWRLEKIAGRAFLGEWVLPLLGFTVTLFGSARRRGENVRRQVTLDTVIAGVKTKSSEESLSE